MVDKVPADIKVITLRLFFCLFFTSEGFTSSRDKVLHITIDTIAISKRNIISPPSLEFH
ncbi:Uncharacterised protein [Mycobacteroides abscessus subsp. abscessus]|nr:Uncharacterised protein [Mycobacteroides abscessus subsp. abscessus]